MTFPGNFNAVIAGQAVECRYRFASVPHQRSRPKTEDPVSLPIDRIHATVDSSSTTRSRHGASRFV
jgi:hypothetical protein